MQRILDTATKECDSPDVRDRAYIYWRLLSTDPGAAKAVVWADKPPISIPRTTVAPALLEELLGEIPTLASVYHKPAETFIGKGRVGVDSVQRKAGYALGPYMNVSHSYINRFLAERMMIDLPRTKRYRRSLQEDKRRTSCMSTLSP